MEEIKFSRRSSDYGCFSNFWECTVEYEGITYHSSEAAWQSLKCANPADRVLFANLAPAVSKKAGRSVALRADWEEVKYELMVKILLAKFTQNKELEEILKSTGDAILIENTTGWHDNIWGNCECARCMNVEGKNLLGKALMEVRSRI